MAQPTRQRAPKTWADCTQQELAQQWRRMAWRDFLRKSPLNPLLTILVAVQSMLLPLGLVAGHELGVMCSLLMLVAGIGLSLFGSPYAEYVWSFWLCWGLITIPIAWVKVFLMALMRYRFRIKNFLPAQAAAGGEVLDLTREQPVEWRETVSWCRGIQDCDCLITAPKDGYYVYSLSIEDIPAGPASDTAADYCPHWFADGQDECAFFCTAHAVPNLRGVFTVFLKLSRGTHRLQFSLHMVEAAPATLRQLNRL